MGTYTHTTYMGAESKREGLHVFAQLIHFVVQQKLTQHCKPTVLKKISEKENGRKEGRGKLS